MRISLLLLTGLLGMSFCAQPDAQMSSPTMGTVTIFREKADSVWKNFSGEGGKWPGARLHVMMTADDSQAADMHAGTFVSFRLAPGRHIIGFKQGGGVASFELHAGERVFIHPGFTSAAATGIAPQPFATVVPCQLALNLGAASAPLEQKHIRRHDFLAEGKFPATCDAD